MADDPQTLAQRVRAKYPGVYDDLSDTDLESKVTTKYPGVYDDIPRSSQAKTQATTQQSPGLVQTAKDAISEVGGHFIQDPIDLAKGAVSGLVSTGVHGGDLIRRLFGMERIIDKPEVQAAMTPPDTLAGKAGKFIEQGAELGAPMARVAKAAAGAPALARWALEGAAGAGVAGLQSGGDTGQMAMAAAAPPVGALAGKVGGAALGLVSRAAAGAQEGGFGGAVAGAIRQAAPTQPVAMMIQALKPRNTQINFPNALKTALPEIKQVEQQTGKVITSVDDLIAATKQAKKDIWAQYEAAAGPQRAMGSVVDGTPIAEAIEQSIPTRTLRQNPTTANAVRKVADTYRTDLSLQDAEQLLKETNAELESYYNKFPQARRQAETANPEIAHLLAEAKGLRDGIYKVIDAPGEGAAAKALKQRYGALMEVENAAQRRSMVAARQQPESLSEQIGKVRAAGEYAKGAFRLMHGDIMGAGNIAAARAGSEAATFLKEQQTTDALIRRAMAGHRGLPTPVPPVVQPTIRGLLPPATTRLGPATVGGLDPSDVPGITQRGQYGAKVTPELVPPKLVTPEVKTVTPSAPPVAPKPQAMIEQPIRLSAAPPTAHEHEALTKWASILEPPRKLSETDHRELERIYEEMEAMQFTPKFSTDTGPYGQKEWHAGAGGAPVYNDILNAQDMLGFEKESGIGTPSRAKVAQDIKAALEGKKISRVAARAIVVARARALGGYPRSVYYGTQAKIAGPLSKPMLPPWWENQP